MDERQKATRQGLPAATGEVAAWLAAARTPAFAIAPFSATLKAANAEGAKLLGVGESENQGPIPLDSAMPAIMDLRRIITGAFFEKTTGIPLVFWTIDGISRLRCNVIIQQVADEELALIAIDERKAGESTPATHQSTPEPPLSKQSRDAQTGPTHVPSAKSAGILPSDEADIAPHHTDARPSTRPAPYGQTKKPTAAPYRTQPMQQDTATSRSVRSASMQSADASPMPPPTPPRTAPPPAASTKQSDKETLKAIARQILAGRSENAPEPTDTVQAPVEIDQQHSDEREFEAPPQIGGQPIQPPEYAPPGSIRVKGHDLTRAELKHTDNRPRPGSQVTPLVVPTPLNAPHQSTPVASPPTATRPRPLQQACDTETTPGETFRLGAPPASREQTPQPSVRSEATAKRDTKAPTTGESVKSNRQPAAQQDPSSNELGKINASTASRRTLVRHMAHELKTPLSAIASAAEIMKDEQLGAIGDERYLRYARDIHESARHALAVIERLLGQPRTQPGELELSFTNLDLNATAAGIVSGLESMARNSGLTLKSELAARLPLVVADATSIRQIVLNLLTNALKFTPPGGNVVLKTARTREGNLTLTVTDTGPGIIAQDLERIMADYAMAEAPAPLSGHKPGGGLGIGLPLARRLANANGATLTITNRPKSGTQVTLTFPVSRQIPI